MNPQIIITPLDRGGCFRPGIIIPQRVVGTWEYDTYVAHEMTHYGEQGFLPCIWVTKYFASKSFRFAAECRAYTAQAAAELKSQGKVNWNYYHDALLDDYWGCCTEKQVDAWLASVKAKM